MIIIRPLITVENIIESYLRDIYRISAVTPEEEQNLLGKIFFGDASARQRLIEANLGLVVEIGKEYLAKELTLADIIQEGNIGLIKAVDNLDYKKGIRFSTYASYWIRQSIEMAMASENPKIYSTIDTLKEINWYEEIERWLAELKEKEHKDALYISKGNGY